MDRPADLPGPLLVKLAAPRLGLVQVHRPRVHRLLDRAARHPVTLVVAPPGAGKTAALGAWSAGRGQSVGWVSLDADDGVPRRLWTHVLAALRACAHAEPDHPIHRLAAPPEVSPEFLTEVVNALSGPLTCTLVLDDLHRLRDAALATVAYLVEHQPAGLRLVLSARADPLLPLHRLRLAGSLGDIRAADLAFTAEEAGELLASHGLGLTPTQVGTLHARTEGWAAGLRLSALSLSAGADPDEFLRGFGGTDHHVAGYLVGEFLQSLPADEAELLLRLSIGRDVSAGLAVALCPGTGPDVVRDLVRRTAFLSPVGVSGDVHRLHQLVRELLAAELRLRHPDEVATLHRRAAAYLQDTGDPLEAARHAVAGGDPVLAADVLAASAQRLFLDGSGQALHDLVAALPPPLVDERAALCAALAGVALGAGDLTRAATALARAGAAGGTAADVRFAGSIGLLAARADGDLEAALRTTPDLGDSGDPLALLALGGAQLWTGDLDGAGRHLHACLAAAQNRGPDHLSLLCLSELAVLDTARDDLDGAQSRAADAIAFAARRGWGDVPALAGAHLAAACVHHLRADPRAAEHADLANALAARGHVRPLGLASGIVRARLREADGDPRAGLALLAGQAGGAVPDRLRRAAVRAEAELLASCDELDAAHARLADAVGDRAATPADIAVAVRLHLLEGNARDARRLVRPALAGPASRPVRVTLHLLDAVAGAMLHRPEDEFGALDRALELASGCGVVQPFRHLTPWVAPLLETHGIALVRHRQFVTLVSSRLAAAPAHPRPGAPPDPLTPREHSLLPYLATLLTQEEISSSLHISVNTTRTHLRALYRKLGVSSRREAVHRAREWQII